MTGFKIENWFSHKRLLICFKSSFQYCEQHYFKNILQRLFAHHTHIGFRRLIL
jgi:hypothetical protein